MNEQEVKVFLKEKMDDLTKVIEQKDSKIEQLIAESVKQAEENIKADGKKVSDVLKSMVEDEKKNRESLQKQADEFNVKIKELSEYGLKSEKSLTEKMIEHFTKDENFKSDALRGKYSYAPKDLSFFGNVLTKADTMTPSANLSNQVTTPQLKPGFFYDPDRSEHVRDNMNVVPTTTDTIWYITETMDTNATQVTAPALDKGQSEISLEQKSETVTKISTYLRLAEEMLSDIPGMTAYLTSRFTSKLKLKEDQQILYGIGSSNQLQGITPLAQAYDGDEIALGTGIQQIDVLRAALAQARVDEYRASLILLHPNDMRDIDLIKDSTNLYVHSGIWGAMPTIKGVPVLETTAINEGDFLVGDFRMGATLWDRKQALVKFSDQDQDNFVKNIITVVFEERLAQTVERPNAFVYGNFATALACGSATA